MHSLQLLAVIVGLATISTCASAFVSIRRSIYPSISVSLQHINYNNKRKGYQRRSCSNVDCRSRSSISLSASILTVTTSISGFYKVYPLLAGVIVGLISRITQQSSRKDTELPSLNNKHINRNKSNFAIIRVLCSGLLLGILFEIMIHGSIIFSICK